MLEEIGVPRENHQTMASKQIDFITLASAPSQIQTSAVICKHFALLDHLSTYPAHV